MVINPISPTVDFDLITAGGVRSVLFGGEGAPSVREWSEAAGTIDYEIITGIGARAHRQYVGGGAVAGNVGHQ